MRGVVASQVFPTSNFRFPAHSINALAFSRFGIAKQLLLNKTRTLENKNCTVLTISIGAICLCMHARDLPKREGGDKIKVIKTFTSCKNSQVNGSFRYHCYIIRYF